MLSLTMLFPNEKLLIRNEKKFETLGILDSKIKKNFLTFIDNEKYLDKVKDNDNISMILTTKEIANKLPNNIGSCICENPRLTFFKIHNSLFENDEYVKPSKKTIIGDSCNINKLAYICEKNVIIGEHVTIEEFVSIKSGTVIGNNSIIRSGTVIGSDGFEFKKDGEIVIGVNHYGGVIIRENVEIKCNTVIDKAIYPWDNTEIGDYSKLDNLIHVGHACKIGKRVMIPANSVIGGRVEIDDDAWIGIGCAIRNAVHIGKNARCNMGAVVTKNVDDECAVSGNYAIDHKKFIENMKKTDY